MKRIVLPMVVMFLLGGCGSDAASSEGSTGSESSSGAEAEATEREPEDGLEVEGLLGHISEAAVDQGMERGMNAFLRCFSERYDAIDVLGGSVELFFRVKRDGSVRHVYLRESSVGDRVTERCLVAAAARLRFQEPTGGEAEFAAPLRLDPPEDVRPPVEWSADRVAAAVRREGAATRAACGLDEPSLRVTAYVAPGGEVLAVGAAADGPDLEGALDCVATRVAGWNLPDPGSYPAKVTFGLR